MISDLLDEDVRYSPAQLARLLGLPEPTAEQAAVIAAPLRPVAVIAGAGSGKSETMAARLVWLVANGLARPERMLGLTFTRKAAAELADRVRRRLDGLRRAGLPDDLREVLDGEAVVSTYHAYAGRLVTDHALREAMEPSMRLITPAVAWQIAAGVVAAYDGPVDAIEWTPRSVTTAVLHLAGELAEHLRAPGDVAGVGAWLERRAAAAAGRSGIPATVKKILACQRTREQLLPMVERYAEAKRAREVLDYGDQVALAARIAQRHPEVGAAERGRYQAVLLDEYQDTSQAQLVLLQSLFAGGHPVTAVGDPCQSIYGWRGASAGNLRRFADDFPGAHERTLATSFRNAGRILDAAATIQRSLREEVPQVPRLVPAPDRAARGLVTCALLDTAAEEADWVAAHVEDLLRLPPGHAPDGRRWPDGRKEGVRPSDIAILCRKRVQFPLLRKALEERDIPVEVVGLGGLLTVPEVQDVVATLRVLHDPGASDALARLLTGPRWRIGPRDLIALGRRARDLARSGPRSVYDMAEISTAEQPTAAAPGPDPGGGQAAPDEGDALTQAIADLTGDGSSLVEALDDLGEPAAYSAPGYARMSALAAELSTLRTHVARPLADLVGEVERTLSLDIEVASRPGVDPAAARADLDAFSGTAAAFGTDQEEATLGAFLAYLAAAQEEEFGLEAGRVGETDTVKLVTVHAAKGLQWPAVVVPGLSAGDRSQLFPAKPRLTTRWTENPRLLPFGLRGDSADLPELGGLDRESVLGFTQACADRELAEERRLMYVAVTRAAFWLCCSGYWWGDGLLPLGPSVFLQEIAEACHGGAGDVARWAEPPADDAQNPALAEPAEQSWPAAPAGPRYEAVRQAAALVRSALAAGPDQADQPTASGQPAPPGQPTPRTGNLPARPDLPSGPRDDELSEQDQVLVAAWERDTALLLTERERRRAQDAEAVELPGQLSVSALVTLARDAGELARQVRRPMPVPPAPQARRGTAFHRWLQQHFASQRLLDPADLLGLADVDEEADADLAALRAQFDDGAWAHRWPLEVEVPFETRIGDRLIRGRIDAVFADAHEGGYDVVDWKTGRPPASAQDRRAVAVQLAAYRLAWAALADVPVSQVRAAFYYVRHDMTVSPADLLDAAGLTALIETIPESTLP